MRGVILLSALISLHPVTDARSVCFTLARVSDSDAVQQMLTWHFQLIFPHKSLPNIEKTKTIITVLKIKMVKISLSSLISHAFEKPRIMGLWTHLRTVSNKGRVGDISS